MATMAAELWAVSRGSRGASGLVEGDGRVERPEGTQTARTQLRMKTKRAGRKLGRPHEGLPGSCPTGRPV